MIPVTIPKANENLLEATLNRWFAREGDCLAQDQKLCEIITDKGSIEIGAPISGIVLKILTPERSVLPVGYTVCVMGMSGESVPQELLAGNSALLAAHRIMNTAISGNNTMEKTSAGLAGGNNIRATPSARRLAKEHGVELTAIAAELKPTGPINETEVRSFIEKHNIKSSKGAV